MTKSNLAIFAIAGIALMMGIAVLPADAGKPVSETIPYELNGFSLFDLCGVPVVKADIQGKITIVTHDNGMEKHTHSVKANFYDISTEELLGKLSQTTTTNEGKTDSENSKTTLHTKVNCLNGEKNQMELSLEITHGDKEITVNQIK
jgi:hypothetical protein